MNNSTILSTATALAFVVAPAIASAATIDLTQANIGAQVNGQNTSTLLIANADSSGVDVTITSQGGVLYHETGDGLGVNSGSDRNCYNCEIIPDDWGTTKDEIDQDESITVSFSRDVFINSVALTDLYASPNSGSWSWIQDESGEWTLYHGSEVVGSGDFVGDEQRQTRRGTTNGDYIVDLGGLLSSALVLVSTNTMWGYDNGSPYKGFSLAAVSFTPTSVPELSGAGAGSALALLLGVGLILGDRRRRQLAPATLA